MGNDSAKSKLTVLVKILNAETQKRRVNGKTIIIKLGQTKEAGEAIRNEVEVLKKLMASPLCAQVPVVQGGVGTEGVWMWSLQSVLPKGKSPARMQGEHYAFLDELKKLGISHGDFAPWNCSIVGGKLFVWDWEDAGPWEEGKDEAWFKGQVKKLLGVDA
jgi:RIO-like serine/threonine protein kinase